MLRHIDVSGFRSIRQASLDLGRLNILIGANGVGKSNLINAVRFIRDARRDLRRCVGRCGGAPTLLFGGERQTPEMAFKFVFDIFSGTEAYDLSLQCEAEGSDQLIVKEDAVQKLPDGSRLVLGANCPRLNISRSSDTVAMDIDDNLDRVYYYRFDLGNALRQMPHVSECDRLDSDGFNLPAVLHHIKEHYQTKWRDIFETFRVIVPAIKEVIFDLRGQSSTGHVALRFKTDAGELDASQVSDGTLRALALVTALKMYGSRSVILMFDEPELGLNTAALHVIGGLLTSTDHHQVIVATQSPQLLDAFDPENVIVTELNEGATTFQRLNAETLLAALDNNELSELYDMGILGGRP